MATPIVPIVQPVNKKKRHLPYVFWLAERKKMVWRRKKEEHQYTLFPVDRGGPNYVVDRLRWDMLHSFQEQYTSSFFGWEEKIK